MRGQERRGRGVSGHPAPWVSFYVSSGELGGVAEVGVELAVDHVGEASFEAADGVALGLAGGSVFGDVSRTGFHGGSDARIRSLLRGARDGTSEEVSG